MLQEAGCSLARDAVDERVIAAVQARRKLGVIQSQDEVGGGGWPELEL